LILADLPYATTDRHGDGKSRIFGWDEIIPLESLWKEYKRILVPNGVVVLTADQPFTSQLVMSNFEWFKYEWIWKKTITTGYLTANYRPMKQTEDILVFSEGGAAAASIGHNMTYNPQGLVEKIIKRKNSPKRLGRFANVEFIGTENKGLSDAPYEQKWTSYPKEIIEFSLDKDTVHPTQKPVALMEYLVRTYSNEGETVLDNTMGSGTTGVAAVTNNRSFIGIEKDPEYFQLAKERIKKASKPLHGVENIFV
jgi:site-specific DNA-methyltransferase (adenine-specific)